jgi:hypothetical protein
MPLALTCIHRPYYSEIYVHCSAASRTLLDQTVGFTISYEREDEYDTRELSEFPDIRLWFVRLDAAYPWFPVVLDWRAGELARYAAMLVPHQVTISQKSLHAHTSLVRLCAL